MDVTEVICYIMAQYTGGLTTAPPSSRLQRSHLNPDLPKTIHARFKLNSCAKFGFDWPSRLAAHSEHVLTDITYQTRPPQGKLAQPQESHRLK